MTDSRKAVSNIDSPDPLDSCPLHGARGGRRESVAERPDRSAFGAFACLCVAEPEGATEKGRTGRQRSVPWGHRPQHEWSCCVDGRRGSR
jgi:hypothetical protein